MTLYHLWTLRDWIKFGRLKEMCNILLEWWLVSSGENSTNKDKSYSTNLRVERPTNNRDYLIVMEKMELIEHS